MANQGGPLTNKPLPAAGSKIIGTGGKATAVKNVGMGKDNEIIIPPQNQPRPTGRYSSGKR